MEQLDQLVLGVKSPSTGEALNTRVLRTFGFERARGWARLGERETEGDTNALLRAQARRPCAPVGTNADLSGAVCIISCSVVLAVSTALLGRRSTTERSLVQCSATDERTRGAKEPEAETRPPPQSSLPTTHCFALGKSDPQAVPTPPGKNLRIQTPSFIRGLASCLHTAYEGRAMTQRPQPRPRLYPPQLV